MAESSHKVQFPESVKVEERHRPRQQPTQKYDRKEIQRRIDIENWMEEQLTDLYQVKEREREREERNEKDAFAEDTVSAWAMQLHLVKKASI